MQSRPAAARRRVWLVGRAFRTRHTHRHAESPGRCQAVPPHGWPCNSPSSDRTPPVAPRRTPGPLVAHDDPEPSGFGLPQAGREHRDGGVVGMQRGAGANMPADRCSQRSEQELRLSDPIGQRGAVEFDAFAGIDDGLAVQRRVVTILRDQHMRDQAWTRPPAFDRQRWHRRLHDRLARPAAQFGRMCWITLKLEGTYSSTSRSSCPIRLNVVPPQPGQVQAGSWVMISRGRWAGSGVRTGCLRWCVLAGARGRSSCPVRPCWCGRLRRQHPVRARRSAVRVARYRD